jgi:hypothetical protein
MSQPLLTPDELHDLEVMARSIEAIHPTFGGNVLRLLAEHRSTRPCIVSRETPARFADARATSDVDGNARRVPRWP